MLIVAAGYLDLLQRELRDSVIHPFASAAALSAHPGIEGQIASTEGAFYISTGGSWRRVVSEVDVALIEAELGRKATIYTAVIPPRSGATGSFPVLHGFTGRPVVTVTGPDGSEVTVDVVHVDGQQRSQVMWIGVLPTPAVVTVVGESRATIASPAGG